MFGIGPVSVFVSGHVVACDQLATYVAYNLVAIPVHTVHTFHMAI